MVVVGTSRIRSETLREYQYREGYAKSFVGKGVECGDSNVKPIWKQMIQAMVESAREVCGSVRVGERTQRVRGGMMK